MFRVSIRKMLSKIDPIVIPPLQNEQQKIVSFLDTKTSLIDSLIEKTQRKIELLKEKRTSLNQRSSYQRIESKCGDEG